MYVFFYFGFELTAKNEGRFFSGFLFWVFIFFISLLLPRIRINHKPSFYFRQRIKLEKNKNQFLFLEIGFVFDLKWIVKATAIDFKESETN